MRLDKYLKVSRLIKRRTIANEACDNGRISVNGRVVKASYEVKVGDKNIDAFGGLAVFVQHVRNHAVAEGHLLVDVIILEKFRCIVKDALLKEQFFIPEKADFG